MSTTLRVDDMSCEGCEDIVENALEEISGVESADADHEESLVAVDGDASTGDLIEAVDHAGYTAEIDAAGSTTAGEDSSGGD